MLNLNLLPPQEKRSVAYEVRARAVAAVGAGLIAVFLIGLALLLPTVFLLGFQKSEVVRAANIELQSQEQSGVANHVLEIEDANRLAAAFVREEKSREGVFPLFAAIIRSVPPSVRLESLYLHAEAREVTIEGFSPSRELLLTLLQSLEREPHFTKVSSPVANLVKPSDIRFSITATVK